MGNLSAAAKWRWLRTLRFWNALPIRAQGGVTVLIPLFAVLVSFGFALYGNQTRTEIAVDIQRKFRAVRQYSDLLTLMINAETGERGFLLTRQPEYLEPYRRAAGEIPNTIENLKATIDNEPGDKPRAERLAALAEIQTLINRQLAALEKSQSVVAAAESRPELAEHLQAGKSLMDEIRQRIGALQNKEEILLAERVTQINSIRQRDYIVIFITLGIGVLVRIVSFYLFDRGIVRRVHRLTEYVSRVIKNEPVHFIRYKKTDALGTLEEKIIELVEQTEAESAPHKPS